MFTNTNGGAPHATKGNALSYNMLQRAKELLTKQSLVSGET